ncbi:copper resistance CopC family protein [Nocardioides sp. YIM 152588]|uniref:copper resistance CopC family protein n=1 Tax=Nocardioides sp. YIM 152588 TaxID=3158259 RepID=UPI0032E48E9F
MLLGLALLGLVVAPPAGAHSELIRSDPSDGGVVEVGRTELSLWFDEPVDIATAHLVLRTDAGTPVRVRADPSAGRSAFVTLRTAPLSRGILVLTWTITSATDGHISAGTMTFGAGVRPDGTAAGAATPRAPDVAGRWLQLLALVVAIGAVVAPRLLARGTAVAPEAPWQAARIGMLAALVALVATAATRPDALDAVDSQRWAQWWAAGLVALLLAAAAFAGIARRGPTRRREATAGLALLLAAGADAASGHAAALPRESAVAVVATAVHVVASGVWFGTLVVLAACLLPTMVREPGSRRPLLRTVWRAFGPVAAAAATFLLASGLYLAGRNVPDPAALVSGWYGLALAGKALVLAAALGTALLATLTVGRRLPLVGADRWLPRAPAAARFPRIVLTEMVVLTVAVVLAAVMTTIATARTTEGVPGAAGAGDGITVDGLFITFEAVPAGEDQVRLVVRASPVTRPQPGRVTGADVLLTDGTAQVPVPLQQVERRHFEGATGAPTSGDWQAWVSVHRAAGGDAVAQVGWTVADRAAPPAGPWEVAATILAALLALAASAALGLTAIRTALRRRTPGEAAAIRPRVPVGVRREG